MTINWKALEADRAAGTPGPWEVTKYGDGIRHHENPPFGDYYHVAVAVAANKNPKPDAHRIARVPDLEAYALEARTKLEAAEVMAADYKIMRAEMAELAEYILKRDGPGLSDYEARGIFADLQRARFRSDSVVAAWDAAQKGSDDE